MGDSTRLKALALISMAQLCLGALLLITGLTLHLLPSGRGYEQILPISRVTLRYLHKVFGFSLAGLSIIHIYLNFGAFKVLVRRLLS